MNLYVTGNTIKQLREQKKMTQAELADKIDVSSKTVSKWETAKGLPDISLLEPLSVALGGSVMELMKGDGCHQSKQIRQSASLQAVRLPHLRQRDSHPGGYGHQLLRRVSSCFGSGSAR